VVGRWVWNEALAFQLAELEAGRGRPTYAELSARLPVLKKANPWLADPPSQALQQTLKDLCEACDKHHSSGAGAPRFKARGEGESLRFVQDRRRDQTAGRGNCTKFCRPVMVSDRVGREIAT
jgi:putative transposase